MTDTWEHDRELIDKTLRMVDFALKLEDCSPELRKRVINRVVTGHPDGVEPPSHFTKITEAYS